MAESVDIKKVVDVTPTTLVKTSSSTFKGLMVILAIVAILFCIYFTVSRLFKKPLPTQPITVGQGGIVKIINEANKRHLILFAEPYFQVSTKADENANVGCRVGVRWEF